MALPNGKLDASLLTAVPGHPNARLRAAPAASFGRIRTGVQAAYGWTPAITSDADAYRTYEIQERIFRDRYTPQASGSGPYGDVRYWNGVRYVRTSGAAAAVPGTSNHGLGIAVDIASIGPFDGTKYNQFEAIAVPEGWSNTEGRSVGEPWHWTYQHNPDTNPIPVPEEPDHNQEDPMFVAFNKSTGIAALIYPSGKWALITDGADVTALRAIDVNPVDVSANTFAQLTPSGAKLV